MRDGVSTYGSGKKNTKEQPEAVLQYLRCTFPRYIRDNAIAGKKEHWIFRRLCPGPAYMTAVESLCPSIGKDDVTRTCLVTEDVCQSCAIGVPIHDLLRPWVSANAWP